MPSGSAVAVLRQPAGAAGAGNSGGKVGTITGGRPGMMVMVFGPGGGGASVVVVVSRRGGGAARDSLVASVVVGATVVVSVDGRVVVATAELVAASELCESCSSTCGPQPSETPMAATTTSAPTATPAMLISRRRLNFSTAPAAG